MCVVLFVLALLIAFWVFRNWRNWTAEFSTQMIRQGMAESQLDPKEQEEIMVQVGRVTTAFKENTISGEQLGALAEKLMKSPLFSLMMTMAIEKQYLAKSGLSEQEKTDGAVALQRFIRGTVDEKIKQPGIDAAMVHVATRNPNGGDWQLKNQLTDEELRAFFAEAKKQADEAGVAEQPEEVDPSEEVRKIVDEAARAAPSVPAEVPAEPAAAPAEPAA